MKSSKNTDMVTIIIIVVSCVIGSFAIICYIKEMNHRSTFDTNAPRINDIITIQSKSAMLGELIDTRGRGFYFVQNNLNIYPVDGRTYNITYYCDSRNNRQIVDISDPISQPEDPFQCIKIDGVCK
jgi:hypothetical protein